MSVYFISIVGHSDIEFMSVSSEFSSEVVNVRFG